MTKRELQKEVERRIQLNDASMVAENKLSSDMIFSLINEAIDLFWKTRYSGLNTKQQGFEQTQKRIDDLRTLVKRQTYSSTDITSEHPVYKVTLPADYAILLGDTAGIVPYNVNDCWETDEDGNYIVKRTDTLESTIETIDRQLQNSLSEHRLKYCFARPLKLIQDNQILLFTDGNYKISEYQILYLKQPSKISTNDDLTEEYVDLPSETHIEIIKLAVRLYSANKPTQNYQILAQETQVME